jgi:hypothetical protein
MLDYDCMSICDIFTYIKRAALFFSLVFARASHHHNIRCAVWMDEGRKEKEEEKKEVECDFHICGISLLSSTHTQGEKKVDGKTLHTHPEQQASKQVKR